MLYKIGNKSAHNHILRLGTGLLRASEVVDTLQCRLTLHYVSLHGTATEVLYERILMVLHHDVTIGHKSKIKCCNTS